MQDPWQTDEYDFPDAAVISERLLFLLNYAVLAPSSHNSQPWLFALEDDAVVLYADRTRALPVVDPQDRELTISCGAALGHLQVAMRYFGYQPRLELFPDPNDPDAFARLTPGNAHQPSAQDVRLFKAITRRRTNQQRYDDRRLPEELLLELEQAAVDAELELLFIVHQKVKDKIALLVGEADRVQFANPAYRSELGTWIHSRKGSSRDGLSARRFGMPDLVSPVGASIVRGFNLGGGVAAKNEKITAAAPTLTVLATTNDEACDWLRAGQFLSRLLLSVTAAGLSASWLNQPTEVARLRQRLRRVAAVAGIPQILLRIGYGPAAAASIRRPVEEVLLITAVE